jgi:hypothetical protein
MITMLLPLPQRRDIDGRRLSVKDLMSCKELKQKLLIKIILNPKLPEKLIEGRKQKALRTLKLMRNERLKRLLNSF